MRILSGLVIRVQVTRIVVIRVSLLEQGGGLQAPLSMVVIL